MKPIFPLFAAIAAFLLMSTNEADAKQPRWSGKIETAVLGSGCFWCTEAVFERVPGVKRVVSGYTGGRTENPTYREVCDGNTGHAEVTRIEFDPAVVSFDRLLEVFFDSHDPTTLNRQGADEGTQYRSAIFYNSAEQKAAAEAGKKKAQAHFEDPIVTEISPLGKFYEAEDYHQDYFKNNPHAGYCAFVIKPKIKKLTEKGTIEFGRTANH
jgi:peptide-methionine (S)-S-oxide reductase